MGESSGLLREMEAEIIVRANRGSCSYGSHLVRRGISVEVSFDEKWDNLRVLSLGLPFSFCCGRQILSLLMRLWSTLGLKCGLSERNWREI